MSVEKLTQEDIIQFLNHKRSWEQLPEQRDLQSTAKGILWGLVFAVPVWALILWLFLR